MTTTIPDLWPKDIKVSVLPPIAVLKAQEGLLAGKTSGLLQAKLATTEADNLVQHQLDLVAPSLGFYRVRLLTATHHKDMLYPVTVRAASFAPKPRGLEGMLPQGVQQVLAASQMAMDPARTEREAATDEEFIRLVGEVLQSQRVRAIIHSLIARINQQADAPGESSPTPPEEDTTPPRE